MKVSMGRWEKCTTQKVTYSQNSITGERMPSASMQLPLRRCWEEDWFSTDMADRTLEGVAADDAEVSAELELWQARRKSCVQLGVFQGCPQVAQGSGLVKEWKRK